MAASVEQRWPAVLVAGPGQLVKPVCGSVGQLQKRARELRMVGVGATVEPRVLPESSLSPSAWSGPSPRAPSAVRGGPGGASIYGRPSGVVAYGRLVATAAVGIISV